MQYRRLGESGLSVSRLSYGNWLASTSSDALDVEKACVRAALEVGITTFDTADAYGRGTAEVALGEALAGQRRESLVLMTKCYFPMGKGPNDAGLGRKHIHESLHGSLRRLGTDYVDVYQAHRFDKTVPLEETMLAFADLVRQGKALYIGTSEWTAEQLVRGKRLARELQVPLISNQAQYSLLWRVPEAQVMPASVREGIGTIVWSPLAQGVLTGKYRQAAPPPAGSRATNEMATEGRGGKFFRNFLRDDVLSRVEELSRIADDAGCSMASLALAWVLRHEAVSTAIIGASRPAQVAQNIAALDVDITQEMTEQIEKITGNVAVHAITHDQTPEH